MVYLISTIILWICILVYLRLAPIFNIIDKPNERSSHTEVTIRGGGVVIVLSIVIVAFIEPYYWLPATGAFLLGVISFVDDQMDLSRRLRFSCHLLAVSILFAALGLFSSEMLPSFWLLPLLYILVIGTINAYNFMDGINGITGLYSLVLLGALQYVNIKQHPFVEPELIWLPMIACGIFLFYNFRPKAKCFAGDVGSITMAYWIVYLLLKLIFLSGDISYLFFLCLYGVDTVLTIVHRLYLRQNIFQPHRMHFYQILANEKGLPHLLVAGIYATLQAVIIALILFSELSFPVLAIICLLPLLVSYSLKFKWTTSADIPTNQPGDFV